MIKKPKAFQTVSVPVVQYDPLLLLHPSLSAHCVWDREVIDGVYVLSPLCD